MIYGIRQFKLAQGQLLRARQYSITKYLDASHNYQKHISCFDNDVFEAVSVGNECSFMVSLSAFKTAEEFDTYLQYLCGLYKVKEIFWQHTPYTFTTNTAAKISNTVAAFIIEGDFDYGLYEEIPVI